MIIGIGHDVVDIGRITRILESAAGERFMRRIMTDAEYEVSAARARRAEFVAGRFAAKEAVVKALGCGIGAEVSFRDIEIMPDAAGKPHCSLSRDAWRRLGQSEPVSDKTGEWLLHISITHERTLASAFAVAERLSND